MTFAALVIERPPLEWSGMVEALGRWLQDAGLYAFLWLLLVGLSYLAVTEFRRRSPWSTLHTMMTLLGGVAALCYVVLVVLLAVQGRVGDSKVLSAAPAAEVASESSFATTPAQKLFFSLAGLAALAACAAPIIRDLGQKRIVFRRIWAIAIVAIKEAWSRGIVWICLIIPLLYLYADWYLTSRPIDQLRNRVGIAYFAMSMLFVFSAALLGAFSIPADLKTQNIFTIVTKPVERYEIVLGRFLGYAVLLFAELAVLTGASYLYVVRGLTDQAMVESYHARVPLLAEELYFFNTGPLPGRHDRGDSVGREWSYRTHIGGKDPQSGITRVHYAIWGFDEIPQPLLDRPEDDPVQVDFSFDIFRTTKGQEGKSVYCTFTFARGDLDPDKIERLFDSGLYAKEYNRLFAEAKKSHETTGKRGDELSKLIEKSRRDITWTLMEQQGVYPIQGIGVVDYHTQSVELPARVFKFLRKAYGERSPASTNEKLPVFQVLVNVENDSSSRFQRVGMAKTDLYILVEDRPFWINFIKGGLCIYLITCIVLALAIVASTYLTGIISLLMTALLCLGGLFLPFIRDLAAGRLETAGPGEAAFRLANRQTAALPLDPQAAATDIIQNLDAAFSWWLGFVMTIIPDLGRFFPKDYVSNGFDITWGSLLLLNYVLPVGAYLLPWAILAYYLIKSREIANP